MPPPSQTAPQKVPELLLDEIGQTLGVTQSGRLLSKSLDMLARHLIKNPAIRLPGLVRRGRPPGCSTRATVRLAQSAS